MNYPEKPVNIWIKPLHAAIGHSWAEQVAVGGRIELEVIYVPIVIAAELDFDTEVIINVPGHSSNTAISGECRNLLCRVDSQE